MTKFGRNVLTIKTNKLMNFHTKRTKYKQIGGRFRFEVLRPNKSVIRDEEIVASAEDAMSSSIFSS